jgi:hypothetical protein
MAAFAHGLGGFADYVGRLPFDDLFVLLQRIGYHLRMRAQLRLLPARQTHSVGLVREFAAFSGGEN